jgi:hypothetical protein
MALRTHRPAEPIPGYRLVERLGGGGFGEVWKCEAPGGLFKAIKIVYGETNAAGAATPELAAQELKALRRVQLVRHPHLLAIERYDIVDGRLLIVTELADGSLWDRFRQCRQQGRRGIPRADLVRYLQETADALDLMNREHHLQHLDVKPQNIFLIHDHVKVGDFGLVADLENVQCTVSGAATPVYAAPETFDGSLSQHCDQYSLAIVYLEMLTGQRPFAGGSIQQMIRQHLQAAPNLSALPLADRPAVARALNKCPDDRFPSCAAFVQALCDGMTEFVDLSGGLRPVATAGLSSTWMMPGLTDTRTATPDTAVTPRPERTADGVLMPAVVIGLGGTGRIVLQRLRQAATEQFGPPDRLPHVRLLYVDTDTDAIREALEGTAGPALAPDEVLPARLERPVHYQKSRRDGRSLVAKWCDPRWLDRLAQEQPATQGVRALGRLAFADHFRALAQKLEGDLAAAARPDALERADQHTRLGLRSDRPRVYVVAGLAGGTGGGMALDVAYLARWLLRRLGHDAAKTAGWLLLPPAGADATAAANAYAALTELHHYSQPATCYRARCDVPDGILTTTDAPFGRLVLLPLDAPDLAADGLLRELLTPLGRTLDAKRGAESNVPNAQSASHSALSAQHFQLITFGLARYAWPRHAILRRAGHRLGQQLLERWTSTDAAPLRTALQGWVAEQWTALELGPEPLTLRLNQACAAALGQFADQAIAGLTAASADVSDALARIEELVARLDGLLVEATDDLVHEWGSRLARVAVCLIEQPDFRLAGAETAIRLLGESIERALAHFSPLADEWLRKGADAHARLRARRDTADATGPPADTQPVADFGTWRVQGMVYRQVAAIYTALRAQLVDQAREVALCRTKLTAVLTAVRAGQPAEEPTADARLLLPANCRTPAEAVDRLLAALTPADVRELDRQTLPVVQERLGGLARACLTEPDLPATLGPMLVSLARDFLAPRLNAIDPAALFLTRRIHPVAAWTAAAPALAAGAADELTAVVAPPGRAAETLAAWVRQAQTGAELVAAAGAADVTFYREVPRLALAQLPQLGPEARAAYQQYRTAEGGSPHARVDVVEWGGVG